MGTRSLRLVVRRGKRENTELRKKRKTLFLSSVIFGALISRVEKSFLNSELITVVVYHERNGRALAIRH